MMLEMMFMEGACALLMVGGDEIEGRPIEGILAEGGGTANIAFSPPTTPETAAWRGFKGFWMLVAGTLGATKDVGNATVDTPIDELGPLSRVCRFCRFDTRLLIPFWELLGGRTVLGEFVGADILTDGRALEVSGPRRLPITEGMFER